MPLRFKIDVLEALKEKGYTTYTLRKENILSQSTIQKLREGKGLAWETIERLCTLLDCQPAALMEFVKDAECRGLYFRKSKNADPLAKKAWAKLPRRGIFNPEDGFPDCDRQGKSLPSDGEKRKKAEVVPFRTASALRLISSP